VPLQPPKVRTVHIPEGRSAAQEAQTIVGDNVRVVSAFQNVTHEKLQDLERAIDCDVLMSGDDAEAKAEVGKLVEAAGMRPVDAGPLANAVAAEALTSVLLYINKQHGIKGAGIRITGI
jgi:NADPH-dependent F420 reductase